MSMQQWDKSQPRIMVVSTAGWANFGDRLGVHLLNKILPSTAVVYHSHLPTLLPPPEPCDMVIVGLGGSMFKNTLSEELIAYVKQFPRRVGIFGTQYRNVETEALLGRLLSSLDVWAARYQDDMDAYRQYASVSIHLGDWLIDAFQLSDWSRDTLHPTIIVSPAIRDEPRPLDCIIADIQKARNVHSYRLHPLLCALTSAEKIKWTEQDEFGLGPSGKFTAMFRDVFGHDVPQNTWWPVNRPAVAQYKAKVGRNINYLRGIIGYLLDDCRWMSKQRSGEPMSEQRVLTEAEIEEVEVRNRAIDADFRAAARVDVPNLIATIRAERLAAAEREREALDVLRKLVADCQEADLIGGSIYLAVQLLSRAESIQSSEGQAERHRCTYCGQFDPPVGTGHCGAR